MITSVLSDLEVLDVAMSLNCASPHVNMVALLKSAEEVAAAPVVKEFLQLLRLKITQMEDQRD